MTQATLKHIEKGSSAVAAPMDNEALIAKCHGALHEALSYNICTYEKILPCKDAYNFTLEDLEPLYAKHGPRLLDFMDLSSRIGALRQAVKAKITEHKAHTLRAWAIFAKMFNVGACDELSSVILSSPHLQDVYSYRLIVQGKPKQNGSTDDHVALAFSVNELTQKDFMTAFGKHNGEFFTSLHSLRGVVVIDAYLEKSLSSEAIIADMDYRRRLTAMGNLYIKAVQPMTAYMKISKEDEGILGAFASDLEALRAKRLDPLQHAEAFVIEKRTTLLKGHLARLFPANSWKFMKPKTHWALGSLEAMTAIKERLTGLGLKIELAKVKDKEEYVVKLTPQDYQDLRDIEAILAKN